MKSLIGLNDQFNLAYDQECLTTTSKVGLSWTRVKSMLIQRSSKYGSLGLQLHNLLGISLKCRLSPELLNQNLWVWTQNQHQHHRISGTTMLIKVLSSAKPINSYQVKQTNKNNIRNKSTNLLSLVRSLASLACWVFPAEALLPALQTPVPGVNQLGRCSCLGWGCRVWRRCTHLNARWQ